MKKAIVGYQLKKISTSFVRPNDTTPYSVGDAISNSTSAPTAFILDFSDILDLNGAFEVRKLTVVSSVKGATLPIINVYLSSSTFATSNDNAALDLTDAVQESGGAWFLCETQNYTASNSRCSYVGTPTPMILDGTTQKLYGTFQAANAYTPAAQEKFTIIAWVALLHGDRLNV
jgi:hypothetical protein